MGRNLTIVEAEPEDDDVALDAEAALLEDEDPPARPPPPADDNEARSELEVTENEAVAPERRFSSQSAIWYRSIWNLGSLIFDNSLETISDNESVAVGLTNSSSA